MFDFQILTDNLIDWGIHYGIKIISIIIGSFIVYAIIKNIVKKVINVVVDKTYQIRSSNAIEKRKKTLIGMILMALKIVITIFTILLVLTELNINIGPLLAGAGIAGLAIGFGAQSLVKDVIAGLFILLEDQYRKGDVVKIAGVAGLVEDINLRRTVLRDLDGIQYHIPHGEITTASNLTKNWARVNLNIPVAYETNLDYAIEIINRVGKSLAEDAAFADMIIKPPQVLGVEDFGESEIKIKVLGDTQPMRQWDVSREFRKRIKQAFDKEGIIIPFPQRDIHLRKNEKI